MLGLGLNINNIKNLCGGGFYPDAQAYFAAVETAGGSLTTTERSAFNAWFLDGVENGWLDSMKAVNFFYGSSVSQVSINVVNPSTYDLINNNFVDGDLDGDSIEANGTTKYFSYGASPEDIHDNPHSFYWYGLCKTPSTNGSYLMGSYSNTVSPSSYQLLNPSTTSRIRFFGNTLALRNQDVGTLAANSSIAISWENSSLSNLYRDGVLEDAVVTLDTGVLSNEDMLLFFWNSLGTPSVGVDGKWKVAALGDNMNTTKHQAFDTACKTLISNL